MINLLSDRYLLLPIVKKSDFIYTLFNLTPNMITILNGLIVTSFLLYYLIINKFIFSFPLLFLRNILDGIDGYLARKYNLVSKKGEIYDHISDSVFIGFSAMILLIKTGYSLESTFFIGQSIIILSMVVNFSENLFWIAQYSVGAGGNYDGYCSLFYYIYHLVIMAIYYCSHIE